jgi:hypothetical protein
LVAIFIKENVLFPFWVSKETGIPYRQFLLIYLRSGLVFGMVLVIGYLCGIQELDFSFLGLAITALLSCGAVLMLIFFITPRESRTEALLLVKTSFFKRRDAR